MRRFSFMAALFLGVALIVAPSTHGEMQTFTFTGAADAVKFPEISSGWPEQSEVNKLEDLPNTEGRLGGTDTIYEADKIGFMCLGPDQGVAPNTEQRIYLPEPPAWQAVHKGNFILTMDMAMDDVEQTGGFYYQGPVVQFLATDQIIEILWINWGGSPAPYIYHHILNTGTTVNSSHLNWDPLLGEVGAGRVSLRLEMTDLVVRGSFKAPGGTWSQLFTFDMNDRPDVSMEKGYRLGLVNYGADDLVLYVDEFRAELTVDPTPIIEYNELVGANKEFGTFRYTAPAHWVERGGVFTNPGATATEFLVDLSANDITGDMVVTSWNTLTPAVIHDGDDAVDANYPSEYIISHKITDSVGREATENLNVYVFDEGRDWAEYNGHWYKLNDLRGWLGHRADAAALGANIVTVNDKYENQFLLDTFLQPVSVLMYDHWRWVTILGLNDLIVLGAYTWENGEETDYRNWAENEPNNWADGGWGPEHVACMDMSLWPGAWMDYDADIDKPWPNWDWLNETTEFMPAFFEIETDPLPPNISLVGSRQKSVALGSDYIEEGATAIDNLDGDLTADIQIVSTPTLNTNAVGEYNLEYTVADAAGNEAIPVTRKVYVLAGEDTRPPDITPLGCMGLPTDPCMNLLKVGQEYAAGGVEVFDDWNGDISHLVDIKTYSLSAIALDVNRAETISLAPCLAGTGCLDQIDISDSEAGDGAVVIIGSAVSWYELEVAPASPNQKLVWQKQKDIAIVAGDIVTAIDAAIGGVYVTKYNSVDTSGNVAIETDRLVIVKDSPPVLELIGQPATGVRQGDAYEELGADVTDIEDCEGTVASPGLCDDDDPASSAVVIGGDTIDTNTVGIYTVTYNVKDSFGNDAAEVTREVSVYAEYEVQITDTEPETVSDFMSQPGGCFIGTVSANSQRHSYTIFFLAGLVLACISILLRKKTRHLSAGIAALGHDISALHSEDYMKRFRRIALALLVGTGLVFGGSPAAYGQEDTESKEVFTLDEILVTATKREESVFEVPLAVSAFDSQRIEQLGMISMDDLNMLAPGLQIGESTEMRDQGWVIRGIGSRLWGENHSDQAVAFYIDGIYQYAPIGLAPGMFDIERIEVARGPQGTLFGRNSIAGSVSWFNKKPTAEWDAEILAEWTDQFSERYGVAFGGPIWGDLRFRVTAHYNKGAGTQENIGPGEDLDAADDTYHAEQLRYKSDRFDINLRYQKTHNKGRPRMQLNLATMTKEQTLKLYNNERTQTDYNDFYLWNFEELGDPFPATAACNEDELPFATQWTDTAQFGYIPLDTRYYYYNKCEELKNLVNLDGENYENTVNESFSFSADWHVLDWLSARFVYGRSRVSTVNSREQDNNPRVSGWADRVAAGELVDWPPIVAPGRVPQPAKLWFRNLETGYLMGAPTESEEDAAIEAALQGHLLSSDAGVAYYSSWYENPYNLFQQSGEMVFFSDFDGPFNFILGAFYYNNETSYEHNVYEPTLPWQAIQAETEWAEYNESTWPHTWIPAQIIGERYGYEERDPDEWGPAAGVPFAPEGEGTSFGWYPFSEAGCNEFTADWAYFSGDDSPAVCLWNDSPEDRFFRYHYQTRAVQETKAIFAHLGWQVNDTLSIAGGMRFTVDAKRKLGDESWSLFRWGSAENNLGQIPMWGDSIEEAFLEPLSWEKFIWDLAVEYNFNDTTMAYVRVATGYRAGGPQNAVPEEVQISPVVEEETLINYETGLKGSAFDQKLWFTTAAFYSPYDGFQLDMNQEYPEGVDIPVEDNDPLLSYISNIDGTEIWGAEVEFTWTPTERLLFSGSYIYMDSSLGENRSVTRGDPNPPRDDWYVLWWPDGNYVPIQGDVLVVTTAAQEHATGIFLEPLTREESLAKSLEAGLPCIARGSRGGGKLFPCWGQLEAEMPTDKTGNKLAMQPNHKWTLTASYTMPMPNLGRKSLDLGGLQLLASYSYTGKRHPYIANLPEHEMLGYGELSLRGTWWSSTGRWSATFWASNALNDINLVSYTPASTAGENPNTNPDSTATLSNPRRLGLTIRYKYGQ